MFATPEFITAVLIIGLTVMLVNGYPLGIMVGALALICGIPLFGGPATIEMLYGRMWDSMFNYGLLAIPLFIFMGQMMSSSGIAEKLFDAVIIITGRMRGGLAYAVVFIGTLLAACIGTAGSSTSLLSYMAMPSMLNSGYDKRLSSGIIAGAGTLGILIPPSVMLIVMGPVMGLSAGRLFFAAIGPGLLLALIYAVYILIISYVRPDALPVPAISPIKVPVGAKIRLFSVSALPSLLIIFAVMGAIFFGIAPPAEAGAIGAFLAAVMALAYRKLTPKVFKDVTMSSVLVTGQVLLMIVFCSAFVGIFVRGGGMEVVEKLIMNTPGGKWGIFIAIQLIIFILGGPLDWMGVVLIVVPIVTPIGTALGFDPLWWAIVICVNLQTSFLSPPLATAIYIIQTTSPPKSGVTVKDVTMGVLPFMGLQLIGVALLVVFPQIVMWLPSLMLG